MAKNRIEIFLVRVESVKSPETLSCHVYLYNKLYDVMGPLTHNNKENKVVVPIGSLVAFQIKTLEKQPKTLFTTVFNTHLLTSQSHFWLPLYTGPQEFKIISNEIQGPRLFLTIKNPDEELTSCTPDLRVTPEPYKKDLKYYEDLIVSKDEEILRLQQELASLKSSTPANHTVELNNKNIDPVEVLVNIYLSRNRLEGLFSKHKGNLFKYGSNFVEIALKDNVLCCRTETKWSLIEEFITTNCTKELEQALQFQSRSNKNSRNPSPKRYARRSTDSTEVEKTMHRRSESFQKLSKPTTSSLAKNKILTKKSPFRC